jgi:putative membrane protein
LRRRDQCALRPWRFLVRAASNILDAMARRPPRWRGAVESQNSESTLPARPSGVNRVAGWTAVFAGSLAWSAIAPKDYLTWWLEVFPALIAFVALAATYRRFRFTPLAYGLILVHCVILMVGGHYTYAEVPLFEWFKPLLHTTRNDYDKVGHFAQGFVPAVVAREILVRNGVVTRRGWLALIVASICLAISALYELFEWFVAELNGEAADAFLGTQGYVWDTQSDMAFALLGAIMALVALSRVHDRQIAAMTPAAGAA